MNHFWNVACVALIATSLLAGCGGGSGGGSDDTGGDDGGPMMSNADLFGNYSVAALASANFVSESTSTWGQVSADGVGGFTGAFMTNSYGTVGSSPDSGSYSVAPDGTVTLGGTNMGGLTTDGSVLVLSEVGATEAPSMAVAIRRSGTAYTTSMLTGTYHYSVLWNLDDSSRVSIWTTLANGYVSLDGSGTASFPIVSFNSSGNLNSTPSADVQTYSISASGVLSIEGVVGEEEGAVTVDGSFAISAGTSDRNIMSMSAYIRTTTGASAATLNGSYWAVGLSTDPTSSGAWTSFNGTVTADGAGGMSYVTTTENTEGVISTPSGADTYAVSPNGTLISGDRIGAVSADGRYAFLSGEAVDDGTPMLFIFVRK